MKLRGKVAVVTGGARGMGRGFAHRLAALGADVAILDIDLQAASRFGEVLEAGSVAAEMRALGVRGFEHAVDLTRAGDVAEAFRLVEQEMGRIDILVNSAGGLLHRGSAAAVETEGLKATIDLNLIATVSCCQHAVRAMRKAGGGVIVNISSIAGRLTSHGGKDAAYAASKAAVDHYTRHLAAEVGPDNIRVNALAPGLIRTSRVVAQAAARQVGTAQEIELIPLRRFGTVEDVADVLEFLVTDLSRYVTGENIAVCGGSILADARRR